MSRVINRLANYEGGIVPRVEERGEDEDDEDGGNDEITDGDKDESKVKLCGGRSCRGKKKRDESSGGVSIFKSRFQFLNSLKIPEINAQGKIWSSHPWGGHAT